MTNPDNVGGLPPLPESLNSVYIIPREGGVSVENPFSDYYSMDQMRAYGELCRAAPTGGDECSKMKLEARLVALRDRWIAQASKPVDYSSDEWAEQINYDAIMKSCAEELTALLEGKR